MKEKTHKEYWRRNLRYLLLFLAIWFIFSFVLGIFFAEPLNAFSIFNIPLGFWIAQQGSIFVFVIIIFVYSIMMNKLDKEFDVNEE